MVVTNEKSYVRIKPRRGEESSVSYVRAVWPALFEPVVAPRLTCSMNGAVLMSWMGENRPMGSRAIVPRLVGAVVFLLEPQRPCPHNYVRQNC